MASELKQNEEGMSDILQTNDSVIRVIDLYNSKMKQSPSPQTTDTASSSEGVAANGVDNVAGASSTAAMAVSAAIATTGTASADSQVTGNALIDLADWSFDPNPISGAVGGVGISSNSGLGSLMDELSALGKGHVL